MRKKLNLLKRIIVLLLCVLLVCFCYDKVFGLKKSYRFVETTIQSDKLSDKFDGFLIAYISDLNIADKNDIIRLESIVEDLNKKEADMILFGGDLFDEEVFNQEQVIELLKSIQSKYGKFAVLGDKDQYNDKVCQSILMESGFEVLHNESRTIHYIDGVKFSLFGLEHSGDCSNLITDENREEFKLCFVHEPDYFKQTKKSDIDLQLSGHTMGGYFKVPFYGGILKKERGEKYINGTFEENGSTLIVSSGLNKEEGQNYRILTYDEIHLITLKR